MPKQQTTFYRYSTFSTNTLESLFTDQLHFASPATFNDPFDCRPTLRCDSSVPELRELLGALARRRVKAEVLQLLQQARVRGDGAQQYASKRAESHIASTLRNIAYSATDPDFDEFGPEEAEAMLLTQHIENEILRNYERGVCCFSTTYSSPLLWSHYGDEHRGLCIGYGVDRKPKPELQRVHYGGDRNINTSTLVRAFLRDDADARSQIDRDVLLRKAQAWRYEREWRLIGPQGLDDSPLSLEEITFGLRCSDSVKMAVAEVLSRRSKPVRFYSMSEDAGRYRLRRYRFEPSDISHYIPRVAESPEEAFGDEMD